MSEGRFSGLSGVLAGCAAAITAVAGLIAILFQIGVIGGDKDTTATKQPTNATWAAQANEICEQADDAVKAFPAPEEILRDPSQLIPTANEVRDLSHRQLRELQKLRPPDEDGPKVKRLLRIYAQQNDIIDEVVVAMNATNLTGTLRAPDQRMLKKLQRGGRAFDSLANELGATTCAEGGYSFVIANLSAS